MLLTRFFFFLVTCTLCVLSRRCSSLVVGVTFFVAAGWNPSWKTECTEDENMKADGDFCGRESGHSRTACPGRWVVAVVDASEVSLSPSILAWRHGQPRHRGCDWHCDGVGPPLLTMLECQGNWYQSLRDAAVFETVSETVDTNHTRISRH